MQKLDEDLAEIAAQVDPALVGTQQNEQDVETEERDEKRPAEKLMRSIPMVGHIDLFVRLSVEMIFPSRELAKLPQGDLNTKLATANLSHTNIVDAMVMSCTYQEVLTTTANLNSIPNM